jgi:hypothetical protein
VTDEPTSQQTASPAAEPSFREILRSDDFRSDVVRQIGGWRGIVESSVPVAVFIVANILTGLRPALYAAVGAAVLIAGFRLLRRQSPRQALNGLLGIALAAFVASRTGRAADFYLPGILLSYAYAVVFFGSVLVRRPLIGYGWAFFVGADPAWRSDRRLYRFFAGLTLLWGIVWTVKVSVQAVLYVLLRGDEVAGTALGVARLSLGFPPVLLLIVITLWQIRRLTRERAVPESATTAG